LTKGFHGEPCTESEHHPNCEIRQDGKETAPGTLYDYVALTEQRFHQQGVTLSEIKPQQQVSIK